MSRLCQSVQYSITLALAFVGLLEVSCWRLGSILCFRVAIAFRWLHTWLLVSGAGGTFRFYILFPAVKYLPETLWTYSGIAHRSFRLLQRLVPCLSNYLPVEQWQLLAEEVLPRLSNSSGSHHCGSTSHYAEAVLQNYQRVSRAS